MYIAVLDKKVRLDEGWHTEILGLYREKKNAWGMIRRLANLMINQSDFVEQHPGNQFAPDCHLIELEDKWGTELKYWILRKEVFEDDEC